MTALLDKLSDLSVRVGDIEARAEAFWAEQQERREQKISAMQAEVLARDESLKVAIHSKPDEIALTWAAFRTSLRDKAVSVRSEIETQRDSVRLNRKARRADLLEFNASLAIEFAIVAIEEAELAVAEAIDARLKADAPSNKPTGVSDNSPKPN